MKASFFRLGVVVHFFMVVSFLDGREAKHASASPTPAGRLCWDSDAGGLAFGLGSLDRGSTLATCRMCWGGGLAVDRGDELLKGGHTYPRMCPPTRVSCRRWPLMPRFAQRYHVL